MQHAIAIETLGPQGPAMGHAIESCVHCGFCLPGCPTYQVLGEEMDSPRGRIVLMKSALEGNLTVEETLPYIDRCLGCQGCVTACPSGVQYGDLITAYRAHAEATRKRTLMVRVRRTLVRETIPYPDRFRAAAVAGKLGKAVEGLVPSELRGMLSLLPEKMPASQPLPAFYPAEGTRRARIALLAGCVQQALAPEFNWATLRVLAKNGVEVVIPAGQQCCGALGMHQGESEEARKHARANLRVFPLDVDAIITNAAGCGSGLHEYPLLFAGQSEAEQAEALAHKSMDVTVFLDRLGIIDLPPLPQSLKVAYHDACHLAHAQKVTDPPRKLFRKHSQSHPAGSARRRDLLWVGRHLQHRAAGDRRAARPAQGGEHPQDRRRRGGRRQHRLPGADPHASPGGREATADLSHDRVAGRGVSKRLVSSLLPLLSGDETGCRRARDPSFAEPLLLS